MTDTTLSSRLTIAKAIYGSMPITRYRTVNSVGVSGHGMPVPVGVVVPVPWDEVPTFDQQRFLKAAAAVEQVQIATSDKDWLDEPIICDE